MTKKKRPLPPGFRPGRKGEGRTEHQLDPEAAHTCPEAPPDHCPACRYEAVAALDAAQAQFLAAERARTQAVQDRDAAVVRAFECGFRDTWLARRLRLRSRSNVERMRKRHAGQPVYEYEQLAQRRIRAELRQLTAALAKVDQWEAARRQGEVG